MNERERNLAPIIRDLQRGQCVRCTGGVTIERAHGSGARGYIVRHPRSGVAQPAGTVARAATLAADLIVRAAQRRMEG